MNIELLCVIEKLPKQGQPPVRLALPYNLDKLYIQNIVEDDLSGPYTTTDLAQFFELPFDTRNHCIEDYSPLTLELKPEMFPMNNRNVRDGHWYMRIWYTKNHFTDNFKNTTLIELREDIEVYKNYISMLNKKDIEQINEIEKLKKEIANLGG